MVTGVTLVSETDCIKAVHFNLTEHQMNHYMYDRQVTPDPFRDD